MGFSELGHIVVGAFNIRCQCLFYLFLSYTLFSCVRKVLLLYSATKPDSFSSALQPYPNLGVIHHLEVIRADGQLTSHAGLAPSVCPPYVASPNFTPWYGEACMEFTSCPRMLLGQPIGSTEIQTHYVHIQSPMHYPFGHHICVRKNVQSCQYVGLLDLALQNNSSNCLVLTTYRK